MLAAAGDLLEVSLLQLHRVVGGLGEGDDADVGASRSGLVASRDEDDGPGSGSAHAGLGGHRLEGRVGVAEGLIAERRVGGGAASDGLDELVGSHKTEW